MSKFALGFPTGQAARLTGLTRRQLAYWDKMGLFRPSITAAHGRGSPRIYSFLDLIQLRVAKRLLDAGLSAWRLKAYLKYLRENVSDEALASRSFIVASSDLLMLTEDPSTAVNAAKTGQIVWLIAPSAVAQEVEKAVEALQQQDPPSAA